MRRRFLAAAAVALLAVMSEPCFACSCVRMDPSQRRDFADVVFTGEVLEIRRGWSQLFSEAAAQDLLGHDSGPSYGSVAFKVDRVYKGPVFTTQWVEGHGHEASCGFEFQRGRTYTVFASQQEGGQLTTGYCTGVFEDGFDARTFGFTEYQQPHPGADHNEAHGYARWFLALAVPLSVVIVFFATRRLFRWLAPRLRRT